MAFERTNSKMSTGSVSPAAASAVSKVRAAPTFGHLPLEGLDPKAGQGMQRCNKVSIAKLTDRSCLCAIAHYSSANSRRKA